MPLPKAMEKIEDFLKKHPVVHAFWGFLFGWNVGAIVLGISNAIDIKPNGGVWIWPVNKQPLKHPLNILFLPLAVPGIFLAVAIMGVTALSAAAFHLVKKGIQKIPLKSKSKPKGSDENAEKHNKFNQTNKGFNEGFNESNQPNNDIFEEIKPPVTPSFKSSSPHSSPSFLLKFPDITKGIEEIFQKKFMNKKKKLALLKKVQKKYGLMDVGTSVAELYLKDSPVVDKLWELLEGQEKSEEFEYLYFHIKELNEYEEGCQKLLEGHSFEIVYSEKFSGPDYISGLEDLYVNIFDRMVLARAIVRFLNNSDAPKKDKTYLQAAIDSEPNTQQSDAQQPETIPSLRKLVKQFSSEQSSRSHPSNK